MHLLVIFDGIGATLQQQLIMYFAAGLKWFVCEAAKRSSLGSLLVCRPVVPACIVQAAVLEESQSLISKLLRL